VDQELKNYESLLLTSDLIMNFLPPSNKNYEKIQILIEKLKLNFLGNNFIDTQLFNQKSNFKFFISQMGLKTPVYEKIKEKNAQELFLNFPQPSIIFSQDDDFSSLKLTSISDLEKIFSENTEIKKMYIEEYIEGEEYYIFIDKDFEENIRIWKNQKIDVDENKLKELYLKLDIKDFILFQVKINSKKQLYFLDAFLTNYDL
jgi:hypothetical protein